MQQRHVRPEAAMCLGFLALILAGSLALMLPAASATGRSIGAFNALFTATSAVCVTGLVVLDTGTAFSPVGQVILLLLIQIGGLGFMVFSTMGMAALGRRITLRSRLLMRESFNTPTMSGLVKLIGWYGQLAAGIELLGTGMLATRFVPLLGWQKGLWFSIWHAVSAFCNAGFDLFGGFASLTGFTEDPLVLLTIAALITLGATGFAVISEALEKHFRWRKFSLHARLTLATSVGVTLCGTLGIAALEWDNARTLGGLSSWGNRAVNALFQSVTMRTAGFNSVDLAGLSDGTKAICAVMMLIGANPASTGGGMKTTTIAAIALAVRAEICGWDNVRIMKRRIPVGTVRRAVAIVAITLTAFLAGALLLTIAERGAVSFADAVFEAASAVATVGVSSAGTPSFSSLSKMILIPMMYLGRVGTLTLALALARRRGETLARLHYPEEQVSIG